MGTGLEGQVAIVTGGGQGIGRGICLCLAEDGADVVVVDIEPERAEKTAAEVVAVGRKAMAIRTDVTKPLEVEAMVKAVLDRFGHIDILVNNAGVGGAQDWQGISAPRLADWDACYEVNLKAVVICSEAVAPHMMERRSGKIVNISSIAGRRGGAGIPQYSASKAACISYTQSLAVMMAPYEVRVNAICPGIIWTPLWAQLAERIKSANPALANVEGQDVMLRSVEASMPLKRPQTPEDIGYAVCFFVSDRAKNITGQALNVDGGSAMN